VGYDRSGCVFAARERGELVQLSGVFFFDGCFGVVEDGGDKDFECGFNGSEGWRSWLSQPLRNQPCSYASEFWMDSRTGLAASAQVASLSSSLWPA
jgi:hypothetical protein